MLPAAGAVAAALAMAPHAQASGFFDAEPTSPKVVNTPLTWSFAANGGEQCDLSSDVGVSDSAPCGTGQYQYTPTTAGTYTLTVSDPSTTPATTLGTSAAVEVNPATPAPTRAGGSASAPSWSFALPSGATATCTVAQAGTTLSSTTCTDPFTTDLSAEPYGTYDIGVVVHQGGLDSAQGTVSYTLRPPAPDVTLTTPAGTRDNDERPTFTITDNAAGSGHTFTCTVAGPNGYSSTLAACDATAPVSVDLTSAPDDGVYTLHVLETAGGIPAATDGSAGYFLDRHIGPVSVTLSPTGGGRTIRGTVSEPDTDGITYACTVLELPALAPTTCGASIRFDLPASAGEGPYTIKITATDAAGNTTNDTAVYTLDVTGPTVAPTATATPASAGTAKHVTWALQPTEAGETFTCGATTAGASAVCSGATVDLTISGTDGSYSVTVHSFDSFGNAGVSFDLTYVLDTTAPAAPTTSGPASRTGHLRSTQWALLDADQGGDLNHYRCTLATPAGATAGVACNATTGQAVLTIDPAAPEGTYVVDVYAVDAFGNETATPLVLSYLLDTHAPAAATVTPVPKPGSTGTTGFSRSPSWSVSNVEPGASVTCVATGPAGQVAAGKVSCSSSAVTLDLTGLAEGSYSVTVTVTDAAGNATSSAPVTYLLDTQAPAAASLTPVAGPGSTGTTGFSRAPSWSVSAVEPGGTVTCAATGPAGALAASKVACSASALTLNLTGLADGTYSVTVTVTDAAGNATTSAPASYVLDTQAPVAATVSPVPGPGSTGTTGFSKTPSWSISNVETGATVTCAAVGPAGAVAAGKVTCSASAVSLNLTGLVDGSYSVTVTVTDAAGNATSSPAVSYLLDTSAPAAATVTPVVKPGSTGTTGFSRSPSWTISNVEPGAALTCAATGPAGALAVSRVTCSAASVSLDLTGLADGTYTVTVTVTDAAGNATPSTPASYVLDTQAPVVATVTPVPGPGSTGTTGFSKTPSWSIGNVEPGATITCAATTPGGGALAASKVTCSGSAVSLNLTGLADGAYSVTVTLTDAAGNASTTAPVSYLLDTKAPAAATVTPVVKAGSTGTTGYSRSPSWSISNVESGASVSCAATGPGGALAAGRVACSATSVTLDLTGLADGTYSVAVTVTDAAGNATSSPTVSYLLDTSAPAAATVTPVVKAGSTGTTGFSRSPSWSLTNVEPGATVTCAATGPGGALAASKVPCSSTTVSLNLTGLADGTYSVTVTVTDDAGNATSSAPVSYVLDTQAPAAATVTPVPGPGSTGTTGYSRSPAWSLTNVEPGATVTCTASGTAATRVSCDGSGVNLDLSGLADGNYTVTVTVTDAAGNATNSPTVVYDLDTKAPNAATVKAGPTGSTGSSRSPSWSISGVEAGAAVTCVATGPAGVLPASKVTCSTSALSLNLTGLADGTYSVTVTVTDAAGNATSSAPVSYVLDTLAPAAATLTPVSGPGSTGTTGFSSSPSWSIGNVEPGAVVTCAATGPSGALAASKVACSSSSVTLNLSGLADGAYSVTVTQTDAAGNASTSPTATYVFDTHAPAAPAVTGVAGAGSTGATGYSRSPSWSISNAEPGATVGCTATGPAGALAAARITCTATGVALDLSVLSDGTYSVTVTVTDAAGNANSTTAAYVLDTHAPAAPTVTAVPGPGSTGTTGFSTSPSWSISNVEPGAGVSCAATGPAGPVAASKVSCGSGSVTLNLSGLADGSYSVTVTVTDAAGNATSAGPVTYVLDTHAPAAATLTATTGAGDTGTTGFVRSPSWTIGNVEPGATVSCAATNPAGVPLAVGRVSCGTAVSLDLSGLADGTYTVAVTVTDAAGNATTTVASYLLDTVAPAVPSVTPVVKPGSTGTTGFSRSPSWTVTGVEPGAVMTCAATGPNGTLAASLVTCGPTVSLNLAGLSDGTYSVTVTVTDAAGNATSAAPVTYLLDTVAPAVATVTPVVKPGSTGTTGFSRSPSWTVTGVEPGAVMTCAATGPNGTLAASLVTCGSTVSLNLAGLSDGTYSVTVTVTDAAGNATSAAPVTYLLDTKAPAAPAVTPVAKPGSTGTTGFSRSPSWTVTGVEPGAVISCAVQRPDATGLDPARVACGPTITLDLNGLADGSYTLVVTLTDAAGNVTNAPSVTYLLDTVAPTPASVTPVVKPGSTGTTGFSRSPSWSLTGVEPGATISCSATGPNGPLAAAAISCGPTVTLQLSGLSDGGYDLTVTVTDAAGNATSASPVSYLLDTLPPAAATVTPVAGPGTNGTTGFSTAPSWSVTGVEPGATVTCAVTRPDASALAPSRVGCGATTSLDLAGLADGTYTLRVTVTDAAGNATTSAAVRYVLDTGAPAAPTVTPVGGPGTTGTTGYSRTPSWSVTGVEAGASISCAATGPGGALAAGAITCGPSTRLDLTGMADGTYLLTVTVTDAAGNATSANAVSYVLDTAAPLAATVTPVPGAGTTGTTGYSRSPSWSVTGVEPGAVISCAVTGPAGLLPASAVTCGSTVALDLKGRADGSYSLVVAVTDAAGNATSSAAVTYLLDTAPPAAATVSAVPGPGSTGTTGYSPSPSWSVTGVEPGASISCSVTGPGGVLAAGLVDCGTTVALQLSSLVDGLYTLTVTLTDAAGNVTSSAPVTYLLDRVPPPAPDLATGSATPTGNAFTSTWTIADTDARLGHYQCTVSGPAGSTASVTCSTAGVVTLTIAAGSPDGPYDVSVWAVDAAGNVSQTPLSLSYLLDTVAPARPTVTPVVRPGSTGTTGFSRSPSWTVGNVENAAAYSCRVDTVGPAGAVAASAVTCGPTVTVNLAGLGDGTYVLSVTLTDAAGNSVDSTPVSYVLDTFPPAAAVVTPVAGVGTTGTTGFSRSPSWSVTGVEPGATLTCQVTGPTGVLASARVSCGTTVTLNLSGQPDGTYVLVTTVTDAAGNSTDSRSVSYVLDTVAPPTPSRNGGTASPANTRGPSWPLVDADPTVTYTCQVTGPAGSSASVACAGGSVLLTIGATSPDGTYVVTVNATDPAGNVNPSPLVFSYVLDTTGPLRPAASTVTSPSNVRLVTWSLTGTEVGETYSCAVDGGAAVTCSGSSVQLSLGGRPDGTYTVTVTPLDRLGNAGIALTLSYVLDTTGPAAPGATVVASPGASRSPSWTLTGTESPETYRCALTTGSGAIVTCSGATVSLSLGTAADGPYAVTVTPFDALGNAGSPITLTYVLDTTGPVAPSASPVTSPDNRRSVRWSLTASENAETYACTVSGAGATVSCDTTGVTLSLTGAGDGTYAVTVTPIDALGNRGVALVLRYTLDTTGPVQPQVAAAPASPAVARSVTWSLTDAESPVTYQCQQSGPVTFAVSCGSSVSMTLPSSAPDGVYAVTVTPYDALLNAGTRLVLSYVLDTTAPAVPVASIVSPGNDVTPTPSLVVEPGAVLTCSIQRFFLPLATVGCGTDGTVDLSAYGDGEYEISVAATDAAGNISAFSSPYTYILDTVAPAAPLLASPASPSPVVDPVWRWSADLDTTATCTVTDAAGAVVTGPITCTDLFTGQFAALPDGAYTLAVVLTDTAGNSSTPATSVFILDRTAPVPPTVVPPASPDNSRTPRWLITAPRGATLTCTLLRGRTVVLAPGACPVGGVVSLAGLPDGTYTMRVIATDSAGNVSAASVTTYVLDTASPAAPNLGYGSSTSGTSRTPFWGFTLPAGTTGRCELLQAGNVLASRNECHGAVRFTINGPDGSYVVRIVAVDAAGNVSSPLVVGYQLYGHGGGGGGSTGSSGPGAGPGPGGHKPTPSTPEPKPPTLQRIIDHLGGLSGQAAKTVRKVTNSVTSALPSLPVIHDPLTNNVSHAVQNVINAVSKAGGGTGFPLLLLVIVAIFLMAQSRVDRRDPKLALASVAADDNLQFGPPPSRGDA